MFIYKNALEPYKVNPQCPFFSKNKVPDFLQLFFFEICPVGFFVNLKMEKSILLSVYLC